MDNQPKPATENDNPSAKGMGKEIGLSGTLIFSGMISGEEYNKKLSGRQAVTQYDIMRRSDATIHSLLQVIKLPLLSALWEIESASDDENDQYACRFVQRELFERNLNWNRFMTEGLTFLEFGHAVGEKTYEMTEFEGKTRIGIQSVHYRKQTTIFRWQMENEQPGITQLVVGRTISIPLEKLIIFTNDQEGQNYDGISILRYVFKDWDMKDKLGLVNAIALEKQGVGIPVLKAPPTADQTQINKARHALQQMRANESSYVEIPEGWDVEMMDMKANTTKEIIPSIQYHDRQIVRSVLAQFLELGASGSSGGSRALSEDHSRLFILSLEAFAKQFQAVVQEQLIKQLCDLNFTDLPNGYPKLKFSKISDDNVLNLAESLTALAGAGLITANRETEDYIRDVLNLPDLPDETADTGDGTENDIPDETDAKDNLPVDPKTQAAVKKAKQARAELIDIIKRN